MKLWNLTTTIYNEIPLKVPLSEMENTPYTHEMHIWKRWLQKRPNKIFSRTRDPKILIFILSTPVIDRLHQIRDPVSNFSKLVHLADNDNEGGEGLEGGLAYHSADNSHGVC